MKSEMKKVVLAFGLLFVTSNAFALRAQGVMYREDQYQSVNRCDKRFCALNDGGQSYIRECNKLRG